LRFTSCAIRARRPRRWTCFNLTEEDPCAICASPGRDHGEIWVVEQPKDVIALEKTGLVRGVYHVLMGHIAPLENVEPGDLTIEPLLRRAAETDVREIILATNPTVEGDGTALYLESVLRDVQVKVTRLARGLAVGSPLEYASLGMIEAAIRGRGPM
jgi:recombination protein RecR